MTERLVSEGKLVPVGSTEDVTLAGVSFVAHMLVAGNYGYFRDELYYIADGHHLQAGYVDHPALKERGPCEIHRRSFQALCYQT